MPTANLPAALDYLPDETKALLRHTIGSRLRLLITAKTPDKKRFEHLEARSGVPSATWRTWWRRDGTPGGQLIEAAAKAWPEHAFWMTTGITDVEAGHTMPSPPPLLVKPYIDPFPETPFSAKNHYDVPIDSKEVVSWAYTSDEPEGVPLGDTRFGKWPESAHEFLEYTAQYLRHSLELHTLYWEHYGNGSDSHKPRMKLLSAARLMARHERWKNQLSKDELKT